MLCSAADGQQRGDGAAVRGGGPGSRRRRGCLASARSRGGGSVPRKISNARNIDPTEIEICKREDGSEYLLGAGSFGQVSAAPFALDSHWRRT